MSDNKQNQPIFIIFVKGNAQAMKYMQTMVPQGCLTGIVGDQKTVSMHTVAQEAHNTERNPEMSCHEQIALPLVI